MYHPILSLLLYTISTTIYYLYHYILSLPLTTIYYLYLVQLIILTNSSFREAPPTRKPLTSGCAYNSSQFLPLAEPP